MGWQKTYRRKVATAEGAVVDSVNAGDRVYLPGVCGTALDLAAAVAERSNKVPGITIHCANPFGSKFDAIIKACREGHISIVSHFLGRRVRRLIDEGVEQADFLPCDLHAVPGQYVKGGPNEADVVLIQVSPPDKEGYVTCGVNNGLAVMAARTCRTVIAQVNENMPRCLGNTRVHVVRFKHLVPSDCPIDILPVPDPDPAVSAIGGFIADLTPKGATIQAGLGSIPDAAISYINSPVGFHTELFGDGARILAEKGLVVGQIVAGMVVGSEVLYGWVDGNVLIDLRPTEEVNDLRTIAAIPKMVAINQALFIDLTGQVCADTIGPRIYSGVGGQHDFMNGAHYSQGGIPIIAMTSTAIVDKQVQSRIVPMLPEGSGVTTNRSTGFTFLTEFGWVDLCRMSVKERARQIIAIAHPDFRDWLTEEARRLKYIT